MTAVRVELMVHHAWHAAVLQRCDGKRFPKSPDEYLRGPRQQTADEIFAVLEGMATASSAQHRSL